VTKCESIDVAKVPPSTFVDGTRNNNSAFGHFDSFSVKEMSPVVVFENGASGTLCPGV